MTPRSSTSIPRMKTLNSSRKRSSLTTRAYRVGSRAGAGLFSPVVGAFANHDVVADAVAGVDLPGPGDLLLGVGEHLVPLGDPPRRPPDREEHGEHLDGKLHRLVDQPGVEVHVRVEFPLDEILVIEGDLLQFEG